MAPDLSYTTTGREGESRVRIINGIEEKAHTILEQLFRQATPTSSYSSTVGVFRSKDHPVTSRSRRSLLLSAEGNIWLLVCRDMAI